MCVCVCVERDEEGLPLFPSELFRGITTGLKCQLGASDEGLCFSKYPFYLLGCGLFS